MHSAPEEPSSLKPYSKDNVVTGTARANLSDLWTDVCGILAEAEHQQDSDSYWDITNPFYRHESIMPPIKARMDDWFSRAAAALVPDTEGWWDYPDWVRVLARHPGAMPGGLYPERAVSYMLTRGRFSPGSDLFTEASLGSYAHRLRSELSDDGELRRWMSDAGTLLNETAEHMGRRDRSLCDLIAQHSRTIASGLQEERCRALSKTAWPARNSTASRTAGGGLCVPFSRDANGRLCIEDSRWTVQAGLELPMSSLEEAFARIRAARQHPSTASIRRMDQACGSAIEAWTRLGARAVKHGAAWDHWESRLAAAGRLRCR